MKRWIEMVLNRPWLVIGIVVFLTVGALSFLPRIQFNASIDAMIPNDDPVLLDLQAVSEDFGSQELFFIAIESDDVFQAATLEKIARLEQELLALPGVADVQSPFNAQMVESSFFGIEIGPLTETLPQTREEIEDFKDRIINSPYEGVLITADGRGAALLLDLDGQADTNKVLGQIEDITKQYTGPENIHIVGDSYIMYYTEEAMKQDLLVLVPVVVMVIGVVLYLIFRSILGVLIPLVTVGASVIWTVAIMIWQGIPISLVTMVMPVILVTVGIASSIHILNTFKEALAGGLAKRPALVETFRVITSPVAMAAWTTSAGFASLVTAFVQPMREFGVLTAIGVFLAMVLSLSLVPALLILAKEPKVTLDKDAEKSGRAGILTRILNALSSLAIDHPRRLGLALIVLTIFIIYGASLVTLESNIVNYFSDSSPVKRGTQVIEDVFGGSMQISVVVDTGAPDGMKDPAVVEELIHIQDYLNSWDTINNATSMADVVRELNQALWDGDLAYYGVPETREGIAQQLLLFTMQGGSGLDALVTYDYSQALVTGQMKTLDASAMKHVMDEVEEYLVNRYGGRDDLSVRLTGTPKVMMRLMNRYVQTQVSSLVSSSIAVGIIVALMMKSLTFGLISLVPLLFTVLINFGVMGFARLPLDAITSIIASLAIGIGIDYAVHYISRYRLELADGHGVEESLRRAGSTAGRGIFFNALALILGFLVLAFSHFRAIAVFGYLISLTMIVSSLAALLVIPMAINYAEKRKLERGKGMKKALLVLLVLTICATGVVASAQELTGQQILDEMSFDTILSGSGTAELTMITENARGAQRSYSVRVYLKTDDAGDQQFLEYLAPADVRGTKFLSINDKGQESQMWLYMPALGRERRIASHMTGDSFMGTDFTYDEIGGGFNYDDDYTAKRLGDEQVGGIDCYVLELTADSSDVLYGKIQMLVRMDQMVPVKISFYGAGGTLAKTLTMDNFQPLSGDLIPHDLVMKDEVQGTRTILEITDMSQEDVDDDIFTVRNLRR
ncbi:MAG TPA: outer membrane lipoprotein-sorting protein [Limnochordia bacterium]|nr:outer membrane lipoprotein-sorting protein [Limnochordia bacterium]